MQIWCPHCKQPLPENVRACACGARFSERFSRRPVDAQGNPVLWRSEQSLIDTAPPAEAPSMRTWCPNCNQLLPQGARECGACGADFKGPGAWQPVDASGRPLPRPPRRRVDPLPLREWRVRWQPPGRHAPFGLRLAGWLCAAGFAAMLLHWLHLTIAGRAGLHNEAWMDALLLTLAFAIFCAGSFQEARKCHSALAYGAMNIVLRRQSNLPLILAGEVYFARDLRPRQRERAWIAQLRMFTRDRGGESRYFASADAAILLDPQGRCGTFHLQAELPEELMHQRVELQLSLTRDFKALYGMPLELPPAIVLEIYADD